MRYACLIYCDPKRAFDGSVESNAILSQVGPFEATLKERGVFVMGLPLTLPNEAMTITVRDGKTSVTDGPFMETKEVLGGLVLLEASDLNEAVQLASGMPFAKLGAIEVRPLVDFSKPRPRL